MRHNWTVYVQWPDGKTEGFDAVGVSQRDARECVSDMLLADNLTDGRIVGMVKRSRVSSDEEKEYRDLLFVPAMRS